MTWDHVIISELYGVYEPPTIYTLYVMTWDHVIISELYGVYEPPTIYTLYVMTWDHVITCYTVAPHCCIKMRPCYTAHHTTTKHRFFLYVS